MSRIGKLPIVIPDAVKVSVEGLKISVEGPKGKLERVFKAPVTIALKEGALTVKPTEESAFAKAMHGTVRSIVAGMVKGVVEGYSKQLEIVGVGFRGVLDGNILDLNLGYSHPIKFQIPEGIAITVRENTHLKVEGSDKQLVGEVAARIKHFYPVEPYKGKGVRIVGQYVRRKEGKKAG